MLTNTRGCVKNYTPEKIVHGETITLSQPSAPDLVQGTIRLMLEHLLSYRLDNAITILHL